MNLLIKDATEKDVPVIAELANRIWRKHYLSILGMEQIEYMLKQMYSAASLLQQMQEKQNYILVYNDEIPVGYLSISTKDHKNYFIHKFYVEMQGKGIGSQLLEHVLTAIKAERIELTVNRKNYRAINFYFKKGFKIKEVTDIYIGNGFFMNDFVMTASAEVLAKASIHTDKKF